MKKIIGTFFFIALFIVLVTACAESESTPAPMSSPPMMQQVVPSPTAKPVNNVNTKVVTKPTSTKSKKTVILTPESTIIQKVTPTANENSKDGGKRKRQRIILVIPTLEVQQQY